MDKHAEKKVWEKYWEVVLCDSMYSMECFISREVKQEK